jgi:superfamily II DNA or RNA helicase
MVTISLDTSSVEDYRRFLAIKALPYYTIQGRQATFPDEYADRIGMVTEEATDHTSYTPPAWMFDYQAAITSIAIQKRKYCLFVDCGFGKTAIFLEFARHARERLASHKRVLIVSPLMVIPQTIRESKRFFPDMPIERIDAAHLKEWMHGSGGIGITNYEAIRDDVVTRGNLGALILDESSNLKSHYGAWGTRLIELGRGLDWKIAATGTPAPNDRIEYANHAVFMDAFPNVNAFLARFFVNRGQTQERWVLKQHALRPFYTALSHWCIFMTNPATYGWTDNTTTIPPIHVHEHEVPLTDEQRHLAFHNTGDLFAHRIGGITNRSVLSQIAKGSHKGKRIDTHKPGFIRDLIATWPEESTLVWCRFNAEQKLLAETMPEAASVSGSTPDDERQRIVYAFQQGEIKTLITKPKILGFGMNLQIATRQVFSACDDSYELYYQAVKRSNRVGSTRPLNVHIPITDIERIQMENVLRKSRMVERDTKVQEQLFKEGM